MNPSVRIFDEYRVRCFQIGIRSGKLPPESRDAFNHRRPLKRSVVGFGRALISERLFRNERGHERSGFSFGFVYEEGGIGFWKIRYEPYRVLRHGNVLSGVLFRHSEYTLPEGHERKRIRHAG